MSFFFFIIYLILTFARPAEHFEELQPWRLMEISSALALAGAAFGLATGNKAPFRAAQVVLMLGLVAWSALTVAVSPFRSIAFEYVLGFAKASLTGFLLAVANVTTLRRLRVVAFTLTLVGLMLAAGAASDYQRMVEEGSKASRGDLEAGSEWDEGGSVPAPPVNPDDEWRIKYAGLFGDPNDLALSLVAILPFTLALRGASRGAGRVWNLLVWGLVAVMLYGVYVTRSRGGVVALAGVLGLMVRHRVGNTLSLVSAGGALLLLLAGGFVGARTMSIDASASGRIEMWSAGLQLLKDSPVWGGGFGTFADHTGMAAHSSYVECFADLGLVGYMLWLAMIVLTFDDLRLAMAGTAGERRRDLEQWARTTLIALAGFMVGAVFLSRAYDVHLFLIIGLGTAVAGIARRSGSIEQSRSALAWSYLVGALAAGSIIGYWLYMRLLR